MGGPQGRCLMPQCGPKTWLKVLRLSSTSYSPGKFPKNLVIAEGRQTPDRTRQRQQLVAITFWRCVPLSPRLEVCKLGQPVCHRVARRLHNGTAPPRCYFSDLTTDTA